MAVDISGGEDSLFWKAGIDTSDFDTGMQKLTEQIQQQTKSQIQVQQQAAQSQKLVAQQILQSAGAVKGVDMGIAAQLRGLTSLQGGIEKIGAEMAQTTEDLQRQIQGLKGQTIELKAKGLDTTALSASLDKVEAEVEKINATPLDIATGKVDAEPLLAALRQVQAEYDKLQMEPLKLHVDTSGLQPVSPIFSQASVDAFKQVQPSIVEAIRAYKEFQKTGEGALSAVADGVARLSAEQLLIKVGGVNTASVEKAFEGLQRRFDGLNNTALVLKVKGVDTASLTTAIDKAKADFEALRGITLSPDMDLTQFQQQYRQLQASLSALEAEKIQLRAEGVDTSKLERDIKNIRIQMAGLSREALRVQVDGSSLEALESQLATLKTQSLDLDFKGMDTEPVLDALEKIEEQIEKIKRKPVEVRSGTVNLGPLSAALLKVGDEIDAIAAQPVVVKVEGVDEGSLSQTFTGLQKKIDGLNAAAIDLKIGAIDTASMTASLETARQKMEQLQGFTLSGTAILNDEAFQATYRELQAEITSLEEQTIQLKAAGLDTSEIEGDLARLREELNIPPVEVPVKIGSLTEKAQELNRLKEQYAALSEIDRNSDIGHGLVQNIQQLEGELQDINSVFLKVEQHAAGSLNEKVAALNRLKEQYAALSEIDRRSTAGKQLAQNIVGLDRDVARINQQFSQTESLVKKAAVALGGYLTLQGAQTFISDVIRVRAEFQKLQAVLSNSLGADEANRVFDQLVDLAANTPAQLSELTGAYVKMVNQGIKPTMQEMMALSDVSAATGKGFDQLAEAIIDAQTGEFERLKEFGIRAEKAGDQVKFSFKGVETQVDFTSGAIKDYIVGLGKVEGVSGASAAVMQTLGGQISNLSDAWDRMLNSIGESNQGLLSGGISGLTTLVEHYQDVLDIITVLVAAYGSYKAAQMVDIAIKKLATVESVKNALAQRGIAVATNGATAAQVLQTGATVVARGAWQALNTAMKANPAIAVATVITTLVGALVLFNRSTRESSVAMNEFNSELQKEQQALSGLFDAAKGAAEGTRERAELIKDINSKYKDYLPQLLTEKTTNEQLADTYKILNQRISENIGLKFRNKNADELTEKIGGRNDKIINKLGKELAESLGADKAGEAVRDLNTVGDELAAVLQKIDNLQGRGVKETEKLLADRNKLIDEFTKKYKLLPRQVSEVLAFAANKKDLKKGLGEIDVFYGSYIEAGKKGADKAEKTLADYLKEKNFAAVFEQALPLAKSKDDLDKILKKLTGEKESLDPNRKDFEKQVNYYQGLIGRVNDRIKAYDPSKLAKENAKAANAQAALDKKENALLEARKDLLEQIADKRVQAEADSKGKHASEIEKINQRYQALIEKVDEFNRKAGEWNKDPKNKNNQVQLLGFDATRQINEARALEISQELMEQDVKSYEKALKEKSALYQQYQQTVKEVGRGDADRLYKDEKLAFDNYLDYLKFEIAKFGTKISLGVELNFADKEKLKLLTEDFKKVSKEQADQQIEDTKRVMVETINVAGQRLAVEARYQKDLAILKEQYLNKGQFTEFIERKKVLDQSLQEDLKALAQHLGKQSGLYRQFNQKVYDDVRSRIDAEIKALADQLAVIEKRDPGMAKAIRAAIKEWRQLRNEMDGAAAKSEEFTRGLQAAQNAFSSLSALAAGFDDELAEAFGSIGQLIGAFEDLQKAIDAIDSAEKAGESAIDGIMKSADLVTAVVKAIIAAINVIAKDLKKVKESKIKSREEVDAFYAGITEGEQQINELMRQRQREQVGLNKLTYERIAAERALLEEQQKAIQSQASAIMQQLQGESFIAGESVKKKSFWDDGIGRRRYVEKEYQSLLGKSFEEIEGLYLKGQLDGKAKELFEQLQKLKQEGADIDRMLEESKREAAQVFTGTTQESITDAILEGLKQGKRGIRDFAQTFEELMQGAMLNALKYQALEAPIKAFYEQFATLSQSGGALTAAEIEQLRKMYASILENAQAQFDQIQQVAGVKFNTSTSGGSNSLQGAIRGITEQQAELLAGQFGGLRLTALEHLRVAQTSLNELNRIQQNTASTVKNLAEIFRVLNGAATGNNPLHVKPR